MPDVPASQPTPSEDAPEQPTAHVEPHSAPRARVRVGRDGSAMVGRKKLHFARSLAGALVTVEVP